MYSVYHAISEIYLLLKVLITSLICILGWILLGTAASKRLHSFIHWFLPSIIGGSLNVAGLLLQGYVDFYTRRDYALITVVYCIYVAAVPFHLVSFARLWKTITALPPSSGDQPPAQNLEQDAGVWPPQPRR